ncbi:hypothetical protein DPMN_102854 [Dreissena polymorpha]|uniref:Uncharacterized protein n=1 Tax=Dreissena polymorpha TaxID=45954 RepID=A0A9D4K239_DREPO|nr:hypothetical protein DPMN_102854 [Dreissena polymorpha]
MMPREQSTKGTAFQTVFKFFKVVCYIFLFIVVLTSAVVNKLCIMLMTSGITKVNVNHLCLKKDMLMVVNYDDDDDDDDYDVEEEEDDDDEMIVMMVVVMIIMLLLLLIMMLMMVMLVLLLIMMMLMM